MGAPGELEGIPRGGILGTMRWTLVLLVLALGPVATAAEVELHFFWAAGCPNCEVMRSFLDELAQEYPELRVIPHEVVFHPDEWRLMTSLAAAWGIESEETPMVFVGDRATVGIGRAVELLIREEVERCLAHGCSSPLDRLGEARWRPSPFELSLVALVVVALLYIFVLPSQ